MPISYPTSLDTLTNPLSSDTLAAVPHSTQHANANDAIEAIETKVGTGSSTPAEGKVLVSTGTGVSSWRLNTDADVRDYGVVGDGATDNYTIIANLLTRIASASPAGAKLRFPGPTHPDTAGGLYLVNDIITLGSPNIQLVGDGSGADHNLGGQVTQDGATQIIGGHTTGPVIRIARHGCRVADLTVSSTATRRAATAGSRVYGIWVEGADAVGTSASVARTMIEHVKVTKQPSHSIVMIGHIGRSALMFVDVDNCNGHGFLFDGGTFTGRTNVYRPGQVDLFNCSVIRSDGKALKIGDPATYLTTTLPFRFNIVNFEAVYNLQDPATYNASGEEGAISAFGEDIQFSGCGFNGEVSSGATHHVPLSVAGQHITVKNSRFLHGEPYIARVETTADAAMITKDVLFDQIMVVHSTAANDYYDPAIYVAPTAQDVRVITGAMPGEVASLLDLSTFSYGSVDWRGERKFVGTIQSNTTSWEQVTLADNQAGYFTCDVSRGRYGVITVTGNSSAAQAGSASYRVGDGSAFCTELSGSVAFAVTTGALTGTTGVDGNLTISADTATNRIYIENRTNGSKDYRISNMASGCAITGFTTV